MGFDCTLHVVDEVLIRNEFVPRLLGRKGCISPFDSRPDSIEIWERVRDALNKKIFNGEICSSKTAAKLVSQFAVVYCASILPYHYERGFCISLRDYYFTEALKKCRGNTEELFDELLTVYPELKHEFPQEQEIEENYCTGIYIPAHDVPKFLKLAKIDYELYRGLWLILKYAEQNGLAYWEATDLPLEMIRPVFSYMLL